MAKTEFKIRWPDRGEVSQGAFEIVKKLRGAGFEAFIAGGAVRDAILKRPIREIDIATSATPTQVKKLFSKTIPTGEKHGTITVRLNNRNYEVTTFRLEGRYEKNRRPVKVKFISDAKKDAERRDFTINAMFFDIEKSVVIDYVNGIADISHKKIRFVGNPDHRVKEDALRMLRAVRFSASLKFGLARETQKTIKKHAKRILNISAERIKQELDRILLSENPSIGIGLLDVVGLLEFILPEVKAGQGVTQPRNQHAEGDVYAHTLLALEAFDETYNLSTRYAVFFHDLGKVVTRKVRDGKITFYDHQTKGGEIVKKICQRLKFSNAEIEEIVWLVRHHMVPNDFALMRLGTRRKWGLSLHFGDLLRLYLADVKAALHPSGKYDLNPRGYREGIKIEKELAAKPVLARPLITGNDVMKIFKLKPGPLVGKILRFIDERKLSGELKTKIEALGYLKKNKNMLKNLSS